ncbi:MAG: hypothetical protein ACREV4_04260 [Gammaproteobacteria bacterium]
MRYGLLLILLLLAPLSQARMYQWVNAESGSTQLSGKPPSWYRGVGHGPRVIVVEKGKIVDDTRTQVPDWQRERLRAEAFGLSLPEASDAIGGVRELVQKLKEIAESEEFLGSLVEQGEKQEQKKEEPAQSTVEQLKAVIAAWDKLKIEQAKALVRDKETPEPETVPTPIENSEPPKQP